MSSGEDALVGVWDVENQREETAEWGGRGGGAGSTCEKCGVPFFWNVKEMWAKKTIGVRQVRDGIKCVIFLSLRGSLSLPPHTHTQHHCCKCGRAVCGKCSDRESTYPPMGYEIPARMCADCHTEITTDE